jgi:DNA polymerase III delta prime subunit
MPLHTTHRPQTLDDVIGNESVVDSLRSVLARDKDKPHSFLFTGNSGCGKCVTEDTFIINEKGLTQFKEYSNLGNGFTNYNTNILSFNGFNHTSHFFKETVAKTIKITTQSGLSLQGTPEHPILIYNKDGIQFKQLCELEINDYPCIMRGFNYFNKENMKINFNYEKHKKDSNSIDIVNIPNKITPDLGRLLGYVIANGCFNGLGISISTKNKFIIADIKNIIKGYGQYIGKIQKCTFPIGSKQFGEFINYLLGVSRIPTARYKSIPKFILNSSKEVQANFIKGLIDCDSYGREDSVINYYTASPLLAEQMQLLLLNFGIISIHKTKYLSEYDWTYHTLSFCGSCVDLYMDEIGSLKYANKFNRKKRNTNIDIIPFLRKQIALNINQVRFDLKVNKAGTYSHAGKYKRFAIGTFFNNTITSKHATYEWISKALDVLQTSDIAHSLIQESINLLTQVRDTNFFYTPITNIEVINDTLDVCDFTMEVDHHFFTNGFVSHNSTMSKILKNELGCSDSDFYVYNSSNTRGIDSIREIQDNCQFAPMNGNVKLYSMEECHMWTPQAMESILVLLEEPPSHVYFVLCTTESDKLKPTIKRRCHHYEMKPLNTIELNTLIIRTLEKEGINEFPENVINKIISVCDGSPGKALNLLDTVIDAVTDTVNDEQAFKIIEDASVSESNIAEIVKVLMNGNGQWSSIARMIEGLSGEPESLRRAFLGYLGKVLLNPKSNHDHIAEMMMIFAEPVFNTSKPGLALEIYFAFKSSQ